LFSKLFFGGFLNRDKTFSLIDELWNVIARRKLQNAESAKERITEKIENNYPSSGKK